MSRIDALLASRALIDARIDRELAKSELRAALDEVAQEPETTIFFRRKFGGHSYIYAAVCYETGGYLPTGDLPGDLLWSTTGPRSPKNYTWGQLVDWLLDGDAVEELWLAVEWERVI